MKKSYSGKVLVFGMAAVAALLLWASAGVAGDYPDKPIRMIYPFPAGSGGDISTRILADTASKIFGEPVKVSNVTGGRATIGAAKVARARKDGYEIGSLPIGPAVTQPIFQENYLILRRTLFPSASLPICPSSWWPMPRRLSRPPGS